MIEYDLIQTKEELNVLVDELETNSDWYEHIVIDTETSWDESNAKKYVLGISIYFPGIERGWYIPINHVDLKINVQYCGLEKALRKYTCVFHNAKFDIQMLLKCGINLIGVDVVDTMMISYIINEEPPHGLKELAEQLGWKDASADKQLLATLKKTFGWEKIPSPFMAKYAMTDVELTWFLYQKLKLPDQFKALLQRDYKLMWEILKMEQYGIEINPVLAKIKASECIKRMYEIEKQLGFDPAKSTQLAKHLYSEPPVGLGLQPMAYGAPSKSFPMGRPAMGVGELEEYNHPDVGLVLEYRRVQKAKSTWYEGWVEMMSRNNRIHPNFNITSTVTSRFSCSGPNMQQIPRDSGENVTKSMFPIKKLLVPTEGYTLYELDYSQVELRLAVVYANEPTMKKLFISGGDPHQLVAGMVGITRQIAKMVNFLTVYGGGPDALMENLRKQAGLHMKWSECKEILDNFNSTYPAFKECAYACMNAMISNGYIKLWTGRYRRMWQNQHTAFNSLIQGGAAEIMRETIIKLGASELPVRLISQVHDSLWVEVPNDQLELVNNVKSIMEWPAEDFELPFPVDVKVLAS